MAQQDNLQISLKKLNALFHNIEKALGQSANKIIPRKWNRKQLRYTQPTNLVGGTLKQYQLQALRWMIQLASKNLNGILADDMGLGKTIQTIAYIAYLKEQHGISGKHIIICPLAVVSNWMRQLKKWLPHANVQPLYATQEQRQRCIIKVIRPRKFDVIITSYQGLVSSLKSLHKIQWETVIIDEAHKIKNDEAQLSNCVRVLSTKFKLLLTGTPLSNNLHELWSLLNFILPQIFDERGLFSEIEYQVQKDNKNKDQKIDLKCKVAQRFHRIIQPFILRRTKKQINLNLPPKTEKTIFAQLTKLQANMYNNFNKFHSVYGPNTGTMNVKVMQLRKICNHPYLFPKIQPSDAPTCGPHLVQSCGKMKLLDKLLTNLLQNKHKVLIFSQFTTMLDIIQDYCIYKKYQFSRIDGNIGLEQRDIQIANFNKDSVNIFLLSTKAGGLGINLIAADRVIIYDIDWNPQNDNQAMDRAYRIGQTRPVHVFKLVAANTIQQRMLQVQKYKLIWDQLVIQKGTLISNKSKKENVFNNINYDQIFTKGQKDIYRLDLQCDDKTIEQLIAIGEQMDKKKNEEIKKKLKQQLGKDILNPLELFQAQDGKKTLEFDRYDGIHVGQPDIQFKETPITKKVPFYHFYRQRQQLQNLINKKSKTQQQSQQYKQLTKKINKLEKTGFKDWSLDQYNKFVSLNKKYKKEDYQTISQLLNKQTQEVKQYSQAFYQLAKSCYESVRDYNLVQRFQEKLKKQQQFNQMLIWSFKNKQLIAQLFKEQYPNFCLNTAHFAVYSFGFQLIMQKKASSKTQFYKHMKAEQLMYFKIYIKFTKLGSLKHYCDKIYERFIYCATKAKKKLQEEDENATGNKLILEKFRQLKKKYKIKQRAQQIRIQQSKQKQVIIQIEDSENSKETKVTEKRTNQTLNQKKKGKKSRNNSKAKITQQTK